MLLVDYYILRDDLIIQESQRDSFLLTVSLAFNALFFRHPCMSAIHATIDSVLPTNPLNAVIDKPKAIIKWPTSIAGPLNIRNGEFGE